MSNEHCKATISFKLKMRYMKKNIKVGWVMIVSIFKKASLYSYKLITNSLLLVLLLNLIYKNIYAFDPLDVEFYKHTNKQELNYLLPICFASRDISSPQKNSWKDTNYIFPFNVPIIQVYDMEPGYALYPVLSNRVRVGNTLFYLIVQGKINRYLQEDNIKDNVTVKYHSLFADGIETGIPGKNIEVIGKLRIFEGIQGSLVAERDINFIVHDYVWSGPDNDKVLKNLVSNNILEEDGSKDNFITTHLSITKGNSQFIDEGNKDITDISTIHVLLSDDSYEELRGRLLVGKKGSAELAGDNKVLKDAFYKHNIDVEYALGNLKK